MESSKVIIHVSYSYKSFSLRAVYFHSFFRSSISLTTSLVTLWISYTMLSSTLRSSLNAVLMMLCVVYAGSALNSAWEMTMKRIVVPMPCRYTYVLLMSFLNYKIFLLQLIHSKPSQTQTQISHNYCFYISLSLILIMIHFPFLLLFLTLKYTLHNVTPYSLSLLNFNVRIHLVHTYIAAVSNHMYITSKFSSNGSHHHMFNDALEDQFTWVKHHNVYTYFVSHQVK